MKFTIEEIRNWLNIYWGYPDGPIPDLTEDNILAANPSGIASIQERKDYAKYEEQVGTLEAMSFQDWKHFNSFFDENGDVLPEKEGESFGNLDEESIKIIKGMRDFAKFVESHERVENKRKKAHPEEVPIEEYEKRLKRIESELYPGNEAGAFDELDYLAKAREEKDNNE